MIRGMPRAAALPSFVTALLATTLSVAGGCAKTAPPAVTPAAPSASARTAPPPSTTVLPGSVAVAPSARGPMAAELDAFFGTPPLATAVWSVLVQSLDTGEVLYRLNPDTLVMPASNQKIVTTAVAAARLGWDYRFETRLEATAPLEAGVLLGDLFVAGTGDPTINARDGRRDAFFDEAAAALRAAGVTRVAGRLVGDDNAFEEDPFGYGWQWDDFAFGYSAAVGPLQVNEGTVDVVVTPGAIEGAPAQVVLRQPGSDLVLVNRVLTGAATSQPRVVLERLPGHATLTVTGTVPLAGKDLVRVAAVDNPTRYFVGELKLALQARGIAIDGDAVDVDDVPAPQPPVGVSPATPTNGDMVRPLPAGGPEPRRVLARLASPPLSEIATPLMKVSQNLYAEMLMRALSLGPAAPASMEQSRKAAEETLGRWGVAPRTYVVADGSGLSRNNYVSATMIVAILRAIARDASLAGPFVATLPIAGKDGTIANRMKGTRAEGNVTAKTGTISNVRSLSGYLTTASGERIVFAMIANNFTVPSAVVDAAVESALERVIARPPAR